MTFWTAGHDHHRPARHIRQGDRIVPADGTVRVIVEAVHGDRSQFTWNGFGQAVTNIHNPETTVTLRCTLDRPAGWYYYAARVEGGVDIYRHVGGGTFERALTVTTPEESS